MKSIMKKKFDFSAEMDEAESIKATPKNEYLEEEKRLLDVNAKELASLNDNVHEMSINLEMIKPNEHDKSSFGCEDEESCVTSQQTSDSFFVR